MLQPHMVKPPFFEIGPKSYLVGDEVLQLALEADAAAIRFDVDVIFTTPLTELRRVAEATRRLHVYAPHMDAIRPGRGLADVSAESLKACGTQGVMLNHCEKPLTLSVLAQSIARAKEVGLATIVCADSIAEAAAVAHLGPDIIVAEPTELIGSGVTSDEAYVQASIAAVKGVAPGILVLQGAGIKNGADVFRTIRAGAEATGTSSGIINAGDRAAMAMEMIGAARRAFDERTREAGG